MTLGVGRLRHPLVAIMLAAPVTHGASGVTLMSAAAT
jgi:hypothetical protein